MARKSLFWPTLSAGIGLVILLGLGTWQLQRLQWKEGLIAAREAGLRSPPTALPATLAAARALEFHPVRADGEFLNDHELYLNNMSDSGAAGFDIVTPLRLADGTVLFVDRGFVPTERKAPQTRQAGEIVGQVHVTGLLRLASGDKPNWFTPDNDPARNSWFYVDITAMAKASSIAGPVLPFYVAADASPNPGGLPQGGQSVTDLPNNHLQYAITWYALALALIAIYIRFARRLVGERR